MQLCSPEKDKRNAEEQRKKEKSDEDAKHAAPFQPALQQPILSSVTGHSHDDCIVRHRLNFLRRDSLSHLDVTGPAVHAARPAGGHQDDRHSEQQNPLHITLLLGLVDDVLHADLGIRRLPFKRRRLIDKDRLALDVVIDIVLVQRP